MPFHPWCFEIYKRASRLRTGDIDTEGLVDWWAISGSDELIRELAREIRDDVDECSG